MKVSLLYFDDCPNWRHTFADVTSILEEMRLPKEVELIKVKSREEAVRLAFLGSPTVRVNDEDIELDVPASGYGLECRIYWVEGRALGRPPKEWIAAAIEAASE